ncbi:SDR family oxidoreductase [Ectobacillus panaciterrae]|uniref:SDR family oxidoreductase n=1 Tax=Ectobacillus panaciterrae TaxID=363872 RepID=UPI0003FDC270|nr:SDR family oxidoreductase [Ectobacillus panaciterrae]
MKVLVTGGAGFIGSHIVDKLIENNYEVVIVDNLSTGNPKHLNPSATFYQVDITEKDMETVFLIEKPNYVIHQAAQIDIQSSLKDPSFDAKVNILGTINVLEKCIKYNVEKIVYASSAAAYGKPIYLGVDENHEINPISFYGISKHTPEHYIQTFSQLYDLKYTILRYANVYGIRQDPKGEGGVVSIFVDKLLNNESPFIFGDGEQTRDFINVKDIASANLAALNKGHNNTFNISCNTQTTVNELLSMMNQILDKNVRPIYRDPRPGDILHSYLDNQKAKTVLGWNSEIDLYGGLKETIQYYSKQYSLSL